MIIIILIKNETPGFKTVARRGGHRRHGRRVDRRRHRRRVDAPGRTAGARRRRGRFVRRVPDVSSKLAHALGEEAGGGLSLEEVAQQGERLQLGLQIPARLSVAAQRVRSAHRGGSHGDGGRGSEPNPHLLRYGIP